MNVNQCPLMAESSRPEKTETQDMGSLQRGLIYWLAEALIGNPWPPQWNNEPPMWQYLTELTGLSGDELCAVCTPSRQL